MHVQYIILQVTVHYTSSEVQYFKRSTMYFVLKYPSKCSEVCFEVQLRCTGIALQTDIGGLDILKLALLICQSRTDHLPQSGRFFQLFNVDDRPYRIFT